MAKSKTTLFECQACGFQSIKWLGKCPNCNAWDQFLELNETQKKILKQSGASSSIIQDAKPITEVEIDKIERFSSFSSEFDLVLGGGVVPGSLVLIGGSPGVGKSTLLLKLAANIATSGKKVLYVSGEESSGQIKIRANRLDANDENLFLLPEIKLESVLGELEKKDYEVLIIDSIQTIYSDNISSAPGSVSQVREITFNLMRMGKEKNIAIFIIGHITKDGSIAGPRVLEHMVDTVLYFEGDGSRELRILRGFKNRFGSTSEIGIFEMKDEGLVAASNVSDKFFTRTNPQAGSALTVIMEGSRPLIIEIQALVADKGFGAPKRSTTGFDSNRLNMLIALLEKKLGFELNDFDIFVNVGGGIKISETSADLAVIAAIISSFKDRVISFDTLFLGEVSLVGDIKDVFHLDTRLKEASMQKFKKVILAKKPNQKTDLKYFEVDQVSKVLDWM